LDHQLQIVRASYSETVIVSIAYSTHWFGCGCFGWVLVAAFIRSLGQHFLYINWTGAAK
jgi:hypothetical protein